MRGLHCKSVTKHPRILENKWYTLVNKQTSEKKQQRELENEIKTIYSKTYGENATFAKEQIYSG